MGANTRIATQWVNDRCKAPVDHVLRNALAIFEACIAHARTLEAAQASIQPDTAKTQAAQP